VQDEGGLRDRAEDGPGRHDAPDLRGRGELPDGLLVERGSRRSAGDEIPDTLLNDIERALNSVVDGLQEPGTELHGEGLPGGLDRVSRADAGRVLVDLDRRGPSDEADDLPDEAEGPDVDDVVHLRVDQPLGDDDRTGHSRDGTYHLLPSVR